jgi:hypothetical protein
MDSKGLKERITSGLIVWLLVTIFIQPILSFAWKAILVVGGFVHRGYVDRIYRGAAIGDRDGYGFLLVIALMMFIPAFRLFFLAREMREYAGIDRLLRTTLKFFVVISYLLLAGIFTVVRGTKLITASFTQRLTVLAPTISDNEYKTLKARWASMQAKADYDALVATMDKRAAELGVTLPPVRKP